ncbi:hypothetical protein R1flu_028530 [Riccia fluitans]|uniref:Uncharacterized protein n=1 Tax=Riccia fluitans TaxID=41844 RepID=A0ABD1XM08_9MARC
MVRVNVGAAKHVGGRCDGASSRPVRGQTPTRISGYFLISQAPGPGLKDLVGISLIAFGRQLTRNALSNLLQAATDCTWGTRKKVGNIEYVIQYFYVCVGEFSTHQVDALYRNLSLEVQVDFT